MFPALSRVQTDIIRVKRIYLRAISLIALVTFPVMLGLFVTADHFVLTLFGAQWQAVIPVLRILSLLGLSQSIGTTTGWIYQSQGRTDWMFRWSIAAGTLLIASILFGVWLGTIVTVASSYAIMSGLVLLYPSFAIPGKLIDMTFLDVVKSIASILACAVIMAVVVWGLDMMLPAAWPSWAYLVAQVFTGIIVYGVLLHFLKIKAYCDLRSILREQWNNRILPVQS
jgi:O-antigen/teichoic acid export membrane protein